MINRTIERIDAIIRYIKSTQEYYSDGVDEELIDMLKDLKEPLEKFIIGDKIC